MTLKDDLATLSINIEIDTETPMYQQIAKQIRSLIRSERLTAGERLPSSRKLAQLLNISRTSTLNAYDQLISEGLLVTRSTSGIFVTEPGLTKQILTPSISIISNPTVDNQGVFDGGPDIEHFPFVDWSRSLAKFWRQPDHSLLRKQLPGGYLPLRQAISRYLKAVRGINCLPEQVIVTAGNRDAMELISEVILEQGDNVAIENPCYPVQRNFLHGRNVNINSCDVDCEGMRVPSSAVKMALMTPTRQYPLGLPQSIDRRLEWLDYSQKNQSWIIEDDYNSEFHYSKAPLSSLYSMAEKIQAEQTQRVILLGSFSSLMFRALRISYLVTPVHLIDTFLSAQEKFGPLASLLIQPAVADFISHRRFASHLRRMRRCYQHRRDVLFKLIQQHLSKWFDSEIPESGMSLVIKLRANIEVLDTVIEQQLLIQGIHVFALSKHYHSNKKQGLILGFSGSDEESLRYGVKCLKSCMKQLD